MPKEQEQMGRIQEMFKNFHKIQKGLPESRLKSEFTVLIHSLVNSRKPITHFLQILDDKIAEAKSAKGDTLETTAKTTYTFWEKIRDMLIDTYKDNSNG